MTASAVLQGSPLDPDLPLAFAARLAPGSVFESLNESVCPVCDHSFESHRQVYPWDDPPMLLCFVLVAGERCYAECGACRRDLP